MITQKPDATDDALGTYGTFQTFDTALLVAIVNGDVNAIEVAKQELASRGVSILTGQWVGFDRAKEMAKCSIVRGANGKRTLVSIPE